MLLWNGPTLGDMSKGYYKPATLTSNQPLVKKWLDNVGQLKRNLKGFMLIGNGRGVELQTHWSTKHFKHQFPAKPKYSNLRFVTSHSLAIGNVNIHCLFGNNPMKHIYWKHIISVIMPFPSTTPQALIFQSLPTLYVLPFRGAISPQQKTVCPLYRRWPAAPSYCCSTERHYGEELHCDLEKKGRNHWTPKDSATLKRRYTTLWYVVLGVGCPCKYQPYKLLASVRNWILGVWFFW